MQLTVLGCAGTFPGPASPCSGYMNVVATGDGDVIEVQGTAEGAPFSRKELDALLDLALEGCVQLTQLQQAALALPL